MVKMLTAFGCRTPLFGGSLLIFKLARFQPWIITPLLFQPLTNLRVPPLLHIFRAYQGVLKKSVFIHSIVWIMFEASSISIGFWQEWSIAIRTTAARPRYFSPPGFTNPIMALPLKL